MAGVSKTVEEDQAGRVFATGRHNNRVAVTSAHSALLLSFLSSFLTCEMRFHFLKIIYYILLQIVSECAFVFTNHDFNQKYKFGIRMTEKNSTPARMSFQSWP